MEGVLLILPTTHLFKHTNAEHFARWYKPRSCKLFLFLTELRQRLSHTQALAFSQASVVIWSLHKRIQSSVMTFKSCIHFTAGY